MQFVKKEYKKFNKNSYGEFILGCDVGGTNTNLGIFGIKNNFPAFLASFQFKSKELKNLHEAINQTLECIKKIYKITITKACLAVPGIVSLKKDSAKIIKLNWSLSDKIILRKTGLKQVIFVNDFEAIGYGINIIKKNEIKTIKKAKKVPKANILVIGAGTGLGKTLLVFDEHAKFYKPLPSEAGHMDFSAQTEEEFELIKFIKRHKKIKYPISYEQVLSGNGISNIYLFLRSLHKYKETKYTKEIDKSNAKPELISKYRKLDKTCKAAFQIFRGNYAKFARNLAIDCFPLSGIYIAGGIAPKNIEIFDKQFVRIFKDNSERKDILEKTPIYLILEYNIGLLGAGFAGAKFLR